MLAASGAHQTLANRLGGQAHGEFHDVHQDNDVQSKPLLAFVSKMGRTIVLPSSLTTT
jgi:hypothetical protein